MLDIGTLHPDPQDGAGDAAPREPETTRVAQATGTLSDVAQPLLGDRSSPGEATAAVPAVAAGAISVAVAALRAVGPAIARALVDGLFNQKTPDEKPAGIGHNSGDAEPLDPAPTPPQQQPPNPLPGAVGAAAALSQQGPKVPATPSGFTSLAEESKFGGHGYANHVNTTIAEAERWVLKRANSRRYGIRGTQRRGVFNSAAEADRLIADVLAPIQMLSAGEFGGFESGGVDDAIFKAHRH